MLKISYLSLGVDKEMVARDSPHDNLVGSVMVCQCLNEISFIGYLPTS